MKNSILIFSLLLLTSCSWWDNFYKIEEDPDRVLPDWEFLIPRKGSPFISGNGLFNMPKYGNIIVAHTNFSYEGYVSLSNDERLCAVDEDKNEVRWYFPSDTSVKQHYLFSGFSHQYDKYIVFKCWKDSSKRPCIEYTICLDVETGKTVWEISDDVTSPSTVNMDVIGIGCTCYCIHNHDEICSYDIPSGKSITISELKDFTIRTISFTEEKNLLITCTEPDPESQKGRIYHVMILDRENGNVLVDHIIQPPVEMNITAAHATESDGIVYILQGMYIQAVNSKTGDIIWTRFSKDDPINDYANSIWVHGSTLMLGTGACLLGYNITDGMLKYSYPIGPWKLTIHDNHAFITSNGGDIHYIDIESGRRIKRFLYLNDRGSYTGYPVFHGDYMYTMTACSICKYRYPFQESVIL